MAPRIPHRRLIMTHCHSKTDWFRPLFILTLFSLLWPGLSLASITAAAEPREQVLATSNELIAALQKNQAAIKQDINLAYRLAEDTVIPQLDFPRIARWVMGKHWRAASEDQRQRLTHEFRTLLIRSYVSAMVTYVDQILQHADNVQFPPERSRQDGDKAMVTMLISLESGKQVAVQYQMHRSGAAWKIYDVQIEGISLALTYRSTFAQEIARSGIEGLIASLAERNSTSGPEPLPKVSQNGDPAH